MNLEVILREDVKGLGKAGALVRVKPGYARNFLLPRNLAYEATEGNKRRIEGEQRAKANRAAADVAEAKTLAAKLEVTPVRIKAKAGEGNRLFGSITAADLAAALAAAGVTIDKRKLHLEHPVKQLGFHTVPIRLHPEVTAEIRLTVEPE